MSTKLKKDLKKILLGLIIFFLFMILDKEAFLPVIFDHKLFSFVLYLIPYFIAGYPVVRKALLGIKNRQPFDESFLMLVATIGAFVTGENSEAVAVMLFYQIGEWFQGYAVGKSRASITELMNIVPEYANVEREDGSIEEIDPDDVEIGDILLIKPGEKIPVDAEIISGESMIDTAALTGESLPRSAHIGDQLISGCINGEGLLRAKATKEFEDSTVSKILELVENAAAKKSRTENFITRFARYYTPIVVIAALVLAILPSIVTGDPMTWVYRSCTFLVISCPCALVISVPLSFFGGIGAASRIGVLVKGSNYLELMANLDQVVSDKTGTLTEGNFKVSALYPAEGVSEENLLTKAALAEGMSTHPIALSIREALSERYPNVALSEAILDTNNVSGKGLIAKTASDTLYVGNTLLLKEAGVEVAEINDPAATLVYVADQNTYLGAIAIRDRVKAEAKEFISTLKKEKVRQFVMLTGDRKTVADAVAKELGVDKVYSELLPQDKVAKVEALLEESAKVSGRKSYLAFIGDGINDAPVLSRADIGIAMGSMGSDAAIEAADIVIMDDNLKKIPSVIRIARKTVRISTENIVFALIVKILILILGAIGLANMWLAVFADVGVAVICILNAMRLLIHKEY
jgi:Zn2+/Cd2+-exporting ATPase